MLSGVLKWQFNAQLLALESSEVYLIENKCK